MQLFFLSVHVEIIVFALKTYSYGKMENLKKSKIVRHARIHLLKEFDVSQFNYANLKENRECCVQFLTKRIKIQKHGKSYNN
jgi:protein-arginine kinase